MQLAIRMPKTIKDALQKEADKEGRAMSNLALKIISDWLLERKKK